MGGHINKPPTGRTMVSVFLAIIQSFWSCQVHGFMISLVYPLFNLHFFSRNYSKFQRDMDTIRCYNQHIWSMDTVSCDVTNIICISGSDQT